jgi:hypothetical protein
MAQGLPSCIYFPLFASFKKPARGTWTPASLGPFKTNTNDVDILTTNCQQSFLWLPLCVCV